MDPHWFQCGSGSSFFTSMRIRIWIQRDEPMRLYNDPDPGQTLKSQKAECTWIRILSDPRQTNQCGSMRTRIHNIGNTEIIWYQSTGLHICYARRKFLRKSVLWTVNGLRYDMVPHRNKRRGKKKKCFFFKQTKSGRREVQLSQYC